MANPAFLSRPADPQAQQPGFVEDAKVYVFAIDGNRDAITDCVNRYLNAAKDDGLVYEAVLPTVLVTFLDAKLGSVAEPYGWVKDKECSIWVLLKAVENGAVKRLVWWMPYVWVDTAVAAITGREVWGFAKTMGNFTMPADPGDAAKFVAETRIFTTLAPATEGVIEPLLTVERTDAAALGDLGLTWTKVEHAAAAFLELFQEVAEAGILSPALLLNLFEDVVELEVPYVNLKQFRDTEDGTKASLQEMVECACKIESFGGGGLLSGDYEVTIEPCQSDPIVADLGLAGATVPVKFAAWLNQAFNVGNGTIVWSAKCGRHPPKGCFSKLLWLLGK